MPAQERNCLSSKADESVNWMKGINLWDLTTSCRKTERSLMKDQVARKVKLEYLRRVEVALIRYSRPDTVSGGVADAKIKKYLQY